MTRIITLTELQGRSLSDLHALYRQLQLALAQTKPGSDDQRNTLASLDAVTRMIRVRQHSPAPRF